MRSSRLRSCLVVAALFTGSSASAQDKPDDRPDDKPAETTGDEAAPHKIAQAEPAPQADPASQTDPSPQTEPRSQTEQSPQTPGARELPQVSDEQLRKMVEAQVAKGRPKGPAVEFSGYARAGVGLAAAGGKQVCFGLPGADTKWRLGNECDYVLEPQFTGRLVQPADGSNWGIVVMPGLYRTWDDPNGPDKTWHTNIPAEFRQIYFFGENLPQLLHGRVWGGRRYYDRLHLDINDQFLEIHDSDGAGVEDMNVGVGKLSVAFLMNPNSEDVQVPSPTLGDPAISTANLAPFKVTARLTDIKTAPEGSLQIWAAIHGSTKSDDKAPADAGVVIAKPDTLFRLGVYHTLGKILGGTNFVGAKLEYTSNHLLWRAVVQEQMLFNSGHTGLDVIGEFRSAKDRANSDADYATNKWFSLGGRLDHRLGGPFRFLAEAGIDRVSPESGDSSQLVKTTGCLAINAGDGPGSRPTIRLFYTHAFWNDAARSAIAAGASGKRLAQVYGDKNNGGSVGIQAEAWW